MGSSTYGTEILYKYLILSFGDTNKNIRSLFRTHYFVAFFIIQSEVKRIFTRIYSYLYISIAFTRSRHKGWGKIYIFKIVNNCNIFLFYIFRSIAIVLSDKVIIPSGKGTNPQRSIYQSISVKTISSFRTLFVIHLIIRWIDIFSYQLIVNST